MKQKRLIISLMIIVGIIFTIPFFYKKQLNKILNKEIKNNNALIISQKYNKDTYFRTNREYIVTLKDSSSFLIDLYPNIRYYQLLRLKKIFDNTQFLVKLNFSNFPVYHENGVKVSLFNLNKNLQTFLSNEQIGKQLLNYIEKNSFEAMIDIDGVKVSNIKLKNLNLNFQNNNIKSSIVGDGISLKISNKTQILKLKKIKISSKGIYDDFLFKIENIYSTSSFMNEFNYRENTKIGSIYYYNEEYHNDIGFEIKNINTKAKISTILNHIYISHNLDIKKFNIFSKTTNEKISINGVRFYLNLSKLDLYSVKKLIELSNVRTNTNQILKNVQTIINKGFDLKIAPLSIKNAIINTSTSFNVASININFNLNVLKNNFNFNQPFDSLFNYLNAQLMIDTTTKNVTLLNQFLPTSSFYINTISKKRKNKVNINLQYKDGKIFSNGKQLF